MAVQPEAGRSSRGRSGQWSSRAAIDHALAVLPALITAILMLRYAARNELAVDFHNDFWVAGYRVAHGISPYLWSPRQIAELVAFPYPATAALLFVPFSLIPRDVADPTFVALSIGAGLLALRLLRVTDWRVYSIALLWWPVVNAWQTANVTLLLVLGVAVVWRYRDRPIVSGATCALLLTVKPVTWPLLVWLLVTRRHRAALVALLATAVLSLVSWAVVGFAAIGQWLALLRLQMDILFREGYGIVALAAHLGLGRGIGTALQLAATALVLATCAVAGRRGRDAGALALAVALMVISSPLVDNHYFALLLVPIAIASPRLSRLWLAPLLFWLCPATDVAGWELALAWLTFAGVLAAVIAALHEDAVGRVA
jgi:Glycosyltransferase family 87